VENALMLLRDGWAGAGAPPRILICGSLYLIGEVLRRNGTPPR
jgi:dihydrofolate synthase/folylpolyglutamate synthase